MTATMAAIRQHSFGSPGVLRIEEVPRPVPRHAEVLVEVRAAGVNPVDWVTRAGHGYLRSLPLTVGWDVSGVVVEVGPGVTRFEVGDEVFGMPRFPDETAGYAAYVTAPASQLARKPARLSHDEAGGLGLAGLTAWQVLVDTAGVTEGDRVLVNAAGGGVGHLAVQIARARGAHVTAVARADKHPVLSDLGAHEVIDYTTVDVAATVDGLDLVLDAVGGPGSARWLPALRPGGLLVPVTGWREAIATEAAARAVRAISFLVEPDGAGLAGLATLADAGQLRVHLQARFPLAEAAAAHEQGERGRSLGKLVLNP